MIQKKLFQEEKKKSYLLNSLFQSKSFYGEKKQKTKSEIIPFIYGIRHKYSIINLKYTVKSIQKALIFLQKIINKKKNILIIGDDSYISFFLNSTFSSKNVFFFKGDWTYGYLTNPDISILKNKKIDLIIYIQPFTNPIYLLKEVSSLKIPIIGIMNTDISYQKIDYPIILNNQNIKSLYFILYLIRKIIFFKNASSSTSK